MALREKGATMSNAHTSATGRRVSAGSRRAPMLAALALLAAVPAVV
jgi:hypothetical protein